MMERPGTAPDIAVVTRLFEAVRARDLDALLSCYHPEVTIHECSELPYGGTYRGREGALEHVRSFQAAWAPFMDPNWPLTPSLTRDGEGTVTVAFRHQARSLASGRTLDRTRDQHLPGARRAGHPIADVPLRTRVALPVPQPGISLHRRLPPTRYTMSALTGHLPA